MDSTFDEKHPRGQAGRFAEKQTAEPAGLDLSIPTGSGVSTVEVLKASADELWDVIESADTTAKVAAAYAANLTPEQEKFLADHAQPFPARLAVATRFSPGCARRAAADPDPVVRARALDGFDLDADVAAALAADPSVARVRELLRAS